MCSIKDKVTITQSKFVITADVGGRSAASAFDRITLKIDPRYIPPRSAYFLIFLLAYFHLLRVSCTGLLSALVLTH